jgi:hypothetical protein
MQHTRERKLESDHKKARCRWEADVKMDLREI